MAHVIGEFGGAPELNIQMIRADEFGVFLNELESGFGPAAHKLINRFHCNVRIGVRYFNAQQSPRFETHCRLLQLLWHHFAQALKAREVDLATAVEFTFE